MSDAEVVTTSIVAGILFGGKMENLASFCRSMILLIRDWELIIWGTNN